MIRRFSRPSYKRSAASLVEFAFVAPVFFLVMLGIFEYGRYLMTVQLLNNAAREGARYAVVNIVSETTAGVQDYVDQYMAGQGATQIVSYNKTTNITVYTADPTTGANTGNSWQNGAWGDAIGVTITGTYQPILPVTLFTSSTLTITGTCVITVEAN